MKRILKVITLDIKKKRFLKNLIISLFALTCILFLSFGKGGMTTIPLMLLQLISFILLVIYSVSLTQEFENKTDKIIFAGIFSRNEIMVSKIISFIVTSIICFIFYEIVSIICNTFNSNIFFNELNVFFLYAFTLGSFILLISAITPNAILTGIIGYVMYFDLILALLNQALVSSRNEMLKCVILNSPFYIANTGFYIGNYTACQSIIMISCGILFLGSACVIINRKNM
ncbi:MAG: ABC-2 type transport system permease protein [Clostridium sp.]